MPSASEPVQHGRLRRGDSVRNNPTGHIILMHPDDLKTASVATTTNGCGIANGETGPHGPDSRPRLRRHRPGNALMYYRPPECNVYGVTPNGRPTSKTAPAFKRRDRGE